MTELDLQAPKVTKPRPLKVITIVSKCGKGSMRLMEGTPEIENLLSNGWKVKRGR